MDCQVGGAHSGVSSGRLAGSLLFGDGPDLVEWLT